LLDISKERDRICRRLANGDNRCLAPCDVMKLPCRFRDRFDSLDRLDRGDSNDFAPSWSIELLKRFMERD